MPEKKSERSKLSPKLIEAQAKWLTSWAHIITAFAKLVGAVAGLAGIVYLLMRHFVKLEPPPMAAGTDRWSRSPWAPRRI